jgi:prevent-host-death family protein
MTLTASKLRENIYKILDEVADTGIPVEITRKGKKLKIVPAEPDSRAKTDRLPRRPDAISGDLEDLVHFDWSSEWKP